MLSSDQRTLVRKNFRGTTRTQACHDLEDKVKAVEPKNTVTAVQHGGGIAIAFILMMSVSKPLTTTVSVRILFIVAKKKEKEREA